MLTGDAKRDYQRDYMRRKRAGEPTVKPPKPWQPTKRMVDQVRYWLRTGASASHVGRQIIEGLDPSNEDEALRRYKAHLDRRNEPEPPAPKRCSFCDEPRSEDRPLFTDGSYEFICEACAKKAVAEFAKVRRKMR